MAVPRFWRENKERYMLRGLKCGACEGVLFPAKSLCPHCRHASVGKLEPHQFSGNGVVETFSVVHAAQQGFELQSPYVMAIVKLEEGPRVTAQIVDCATSAVEIGSAVKAVFRKINAEGDAGIVQYGYKFVMA